MRLTAIPAETRLAAPAGRHVAHRRKPDGS
jgi:hypothetical protein